MYPAPFKMKREEKKLFLNIINISMNIPDHYFSTFASWKRFTHFSFPPYNRSHL